VRGLVAIALLAGPAFGCSGAVRPIEADDFLGLRAVLCDERLTAMGIDVERENARAAELARVMMRSGAWNSQNFHALIVPGYTPKNARVPLVELDPIAKERLFRAVLALQRHEAPFVIVSGGNVYPKDTPFNEALQMKQYLRALGVPAERILIEPCSRYSYTNLRNAGRLMLSFGMWRGLVVTSYDQAFYIGRPFSTTFGPRMQSKLGYQVGDLRITFGQDVAFVPNRKVFLRGSDALDP
jgi:hypothetical protein